MLILPSWYDLLQRLHGSTAAELHCTRVTGTHSHHHPPQLHPDPKPPWGQGPRQNSTCFSAHDVDAGAEERESPESELRVAGLPTLLPLRAQGCAGLWWLDAVAIFHDSSRMLIAIFTKISL